MKKRSYFSGYCNLLAIVAVFVSLSATDLRTYAISLMMGFLFIGLSVGHKIASRAAEKEERARLNRQWDLAEKTILEAMEDDHEAAEGTLMGISREDLAHKEDSDEDE